MHILFAGGGTAGHINPALAVANYIKTVRPDTTISYIGTANGLESRLVPAAGYDFYTIEVAGFQRKQSLQNIKKNIAAIGKAVNGSLASKKLLKELKPDVVVGTGGYVSGPVLRQAAKLGIKTAIHEQNAFPGVTTKMLLYSADKVMLAMPEAKERLKFDREYIITGNPIRNSLITANRSESRKKLGLAAGEKLVLSFGGSLGARAINESMAGVIKHAADSGDFCVYHATGRSGYNGMIELMNETGIETNSHCVRVVEYIDNMNELLAAADLVICRAGAITLGELEACGKPSILIPSPYVAENHQYFNALTLKDNGAAELIEEKDLTSERLLSEVLALVSNDERLKSMSENARRIAITGADKKIADVIFELAESSGKK